MKKLFATLLALALLLCGMATLAESTASDESDMDQVLCGEWLECETQFTQMTIEKNPASGWDVGIASPLTHGAYIFKTTIQYDDDQQCFTYDKGKFWDVPVTEEENPELGEAKIAGTTGRLVLTGDEDSPRLSWHDDQGEDTEVLFERADAGSAVTAHDFLGEWVNQDGTANIDIEAHDDEGNYVANVQLNNADGGADYLVWAYGCVYDEDAHALVSVSRFAGTGDNASGEEDVTDSNLEYTDARFRFDDAGMLVWDDANETTDDGMLFEHTIGWVDPDYVGPGHHFVGEWNDERVSIVIKETMDDYQVTVAGSGGAFSGAYWAYTCYYDEETDSLITDGQVASMVEYTYSEDGEDYSEEVIYEDGVAMFRLDEEGRLLWYDKKDDAGAGRTFERATVEAEDAGLQDEEEPTSRIVTPNNPEIDIEVLADGEYPAAFESAALTDGTLTFTVYCEDTFDIVEISQLSEGDSIYVGDARVEVETLERDDDGDLLINGGLDEGGVTLRAYDEDNCWRAVEYDDHHTYTKWGETTLPLSEDVTFTDGWNIEKEPVTVTGAEVVAEAIAATELDAFIPESSTVRVEGGQIVEIVRVFIP